MQFVTDQAIQGIDDFAEGATGRWPSYAHRHIAAERWMDATLGVRVGGYAKDFSLILERDSAPHEWFRHVSVVTYEPETCDGGGQQDAVVLVDDVKLMQDLQRMCAGDRTVEWPALFDEVRRLRRDTAQLPTVLPLEAVLGAVPIDRKFGIGVWSPAVQKNKVPDHVIECAPQVVRHSRQVGDPTPWAAAM